MDASTSEKPYTAGVWADNYLSLNLRYDCEHDHHFRQYDLICTQKKYQAGNGKWNYLKEPD